MLALHPQKLNPGHLLKMLVTVGRPDSDTQFTYTVDCSTNVIAADSAHVLLVHTGQIVEVPRKDVDRSSCLLVRTRIQHYFEYASGSGSFGKLSDEHLSKIPCSLRWVWCWVDGTIIALAPLQAARKKARTLRRVQLLLALREIVQIAGVEAEMRDMLPGIVLAACPRLRWR